MFIKNFLIFLIIIFLCNFNYLFSIEPSEILENELLEERARNISKKIRCIVCQNENIDSSDSEIAKDLRILIRDRILIGESDRKIEDYISDRYGDFILLIPKKSGLNLILWFFPPLLFLISLLFTLRFIFKKSKIIEVEKNK